MNPREREREVISAVKHDKSRFKNSILRELFLRHAWLSTPRVETFEK